MLESTSNKISNLEKMDKLTLEELTSRVLPETDYSQKNKTGIYLWLHNIRSMYNVGCIFRTADGAGIEKIFISGYTATPDRVQVQKTALGAERSVPWEFVGPDTNYLDSKEEHFQKIKEKIDNLKKKGINFIGLEQTQQSKDYCENKYDFPLCIVLGNEVNGIEEPLLNSLDSAVEIPMYGSKHSLNVSVSMGIIAYKIREQLSF